MPTYSNSPEVATAFRSLEARSRVLDAGLLRHAREVEITASESRSGELRDRLSERRCAALKRFVKQNRACRFALRIVADAETAKPIQEGCGLPAHWEDVKEPTTAFIRELPTRVHEPMRFRLSDAEVSAWPGVTLQFPRDNWGRATIREAFVVLVVPKDASAGRPAGDRREGASAQLGLFGS